MNTSTLAQAVVRPTGNGLLVALLKYAVSFLARAENKQPAARAAAPVIEAPVSNDVDLWKLYWVATSAGSSNAKVRQMLQRAAGE